MWSTDQVMVYELLLIHGTVSIKLRRKHLETFIVIFQSNFTMSINYKNGACILYVIFYVIFFVIICLLTVDFFLLMDYIYCFLAYLVFFFYWIVESMNFHYQVLDFAIFLYLAVDFIQ